MSGAKFDAGKPRMGLISSKFLWGLATVLTFGAIKYTKAGACTCTSNSNGHALGCPTVTIVKGDHNWRKGLSHSRVYDALQRHLTAWNDGEDSDKDSGYSHLDHAACELMFLRELSVTRPDLDDRYKLIAVSQEAPPRKPKKSPGEVPGPELFQRVRKENTTAFSGLEIGDAQFSAIEAPCGHVVRDGWRCRVSECQPEQVA